MLNFFTRSLATGVLSITTLFFSHAANAGAFYDRIRANDARQEQERAQAQAEGNWREQVALKKQIYKFAARHGGLRDAGDCGPATTGNCAIIPGFCVPTIDTKLTVAQLGVVGTHIDQCEAALRDGSACEFKDDYWSLNSGRTSENAPFPKLAAKCYDAHNNYKTTYQY